MNSHEHAVASPNVRITNTRIDDGTISLWMTPRNNNKCWIYVTQWIQLQKLMVPDTKKK